MLHFDLLGLLKFLKRETLSQKVISYATEHFK